MDNPSGNQLSIIPFMGTPGITLLNYSWKEEDFYLLLVTKEMFQDIAEQTNTYAMKTLV